MICSIKHPYISVDRVSEICEHTDSTPIVEFEFWPTVIKFPLVWVKKLFLALKNRQLVTFLILLLFSPISFIAYLINKNRKHETDQRNIKQANLERQAGEQLSNARCELYKAAAALDAVATTEAKGLANPELAAEKVAVAVAEAKLMTMKRGPRIIRCSPLPSTPDNSTKAQPNKDAADAAADQIKAMDKSKFIKFLKDHQKYLYAKKNKNHEILQEIYNLRPLEYRDLITKSQGLEKNIYDKLKGDHQKTYLSFITSENELDSTIMPRSRWKSLIPEINGHLENWDKHLAPIIGVNKETAERLKVLQKSGGDNEDIFAIRVNYNNERFHHAKFVRMQDPNGEDGKFYACFEFIDSNVKIEKGNVFELHCNTEKLNEAVAKAKAEADTAIANVAKAIAAA